MKALLYNCKEFGPAKPGTGAYVPSAAQAECRASHRSSNGLAQ